MTRIQRTLIHTGLQEITELVTALNNTLPQTVEVTRNEGTAMLGKVRRAKELLKSIKLKPQ